MNPIPVEPEQADTLTERARTLLDLGRPHEALSLLRGALAAGPEDYETLWLLSRAHGFCGDLTGALTWAERAIGAEPDEAGGFWLRACHLFNAGRFREAVSAAEESVFLAPEDPYAVEMLARAQIYARDLEDADETLDLLGDLAPESYWLPELSGGLAMQRGQWPEAEEYWRRALEIEPESSNALTNLGLALTYRSFRMVEALEGDCLREALDCLYRATVLDPFNTATRRSLTLVLDTYLGAPRLGFFSLTAFWPFALFLTGVCGGLPYAGVLGLFLPVSALFGLVVLGDLRLGRRRFRSLPRHLQDFWRRCGPRGVRRYPWT